MNNNYKEIHLKKNKEYLELQEKTRNEKDIDKRNQYLTELSKLNINLNALEVIFENNRIDTHLMDQLDLKTKAELMDAALSEE